MTDLSDFFGDMDITDARTDEEGNVTLSRINLEPYREFLKRLPVGKEGRLTVDTGEIIPEFKVNRYGDPVVDDNGNPVRNVNRGRGMNELEAFRAFRTVANQEYNLGIDIRYQHLNDGRTMFRMAMHKKRETTPEGAANREAARRKGLLKRAENRVNTTQAALAKNPDDPKVKENAVKAKATYDRMLAENGAVTPQKAAAPAAKATARTS